MRRTPRRLGVAALVLAGAGLIALAAPALAAKDDVVLISRATGPAGAPVDATAAISSASASGERVAFDTDANNISAEDNDAFRNVFVRDAATNVTTFVSRATGAAGAGGDATSQDPSISGNGLVVAFESDANNLSTEDNDAFTNVFVRDLAAGTTTLVSRADGPGGAAGNASSVNPDISDDGRFVVFQSGADNLSVDDNNGFINIFVRDLVAGTTALVSRAPNANGAGANGNSAAPSISGDGNRVAFDSAANNLSIEDNNAVNNIFVRDLAAATNAFVSRATGPAGAPGDGASSSADISRSGRYVTFQSASNNLSLDDNNAVGNIFLRDLDESTTRLMSRASGPGGAGADASSFSPVAADNARVAFHSAANNLSADDNDAFTNVFVRDALVDTTELVSRAPGAAGAAANNNSAAPTTSADGRYVAFQSVATNLVAGTIPGVTNIYRRDVLGDAPVATPVCKILPLPPAAGDEEEATFTLSVQQLRINQRISQAAIRRLNAVEARLNGGLQARDLCGYSVGPAQLGAGITSSPAAASLAPASPADPAPITDPGRRPGPGDPLTLSAEQLLINQRIDQAAIRRATGITARLQAGLSGGDVRAGQVTQGKLYDRLQIVAVLPAAEPPATQTVIPPRRNPPDPGSVTLSTGQLRINQRIAQAGVRNANSLIRRLETGLSGADLRLSTLTAADLG
jgi:Tol biopolymer transport system component